VNALSNAILLVVDVSQSIYETTWVPDARFALDRDDEISAAAWQSLESSRFIISSRI
jgi:hypothetical protein